MGRVGECDRGLDRRGVDAALDLILFERERAIGNLGVGGPAVEMSQGRGNEA